MAKGLGRNLVLGALAGGVLHVVLVTLGLVVLGWVVGALRVSESEEATAWALVLGVLSSPGGGIVGAVAGALAARTRLSVLAIGGVGAGLGLLVGGIVAVGLISMSTGNRVVALLLLFFFVAVGGLIATAVGGWRARVAR